MNTIAAIITEIAKQLGAEGVDATFSYPTQIEYVEERCFLYVENMCTRSTACHDGWWVGFGGAGNDSVHVSRADEDDLFDLEQHKETEKRDDIHGEGDFNKWRREPVG